MKPEPLHGGLEAQVVQVNHEIDSPSAADCLLPIHEFLASDGKAPPVGMPLGLVVSITLGSSEEKYGLQGNASDAIGSVFYLLENHGCCSSLGLRLTQFFMLITWLFSVSRSIRAAVR